MRDGVIATGCLAVLLAGCAAPPQPPLLPLAETVLTDEPTTYRVMPFRWTVGTQLVYETYAYEAIDLSGKRPTREQVRVRETLIAHERTGQGHMRVEAALDGTRFADLFFDEEGFPVDFIFDRSGLTRLGLSPDFGVDMSPVFLTLVHLRRQLAGKSLSQRQAFTFSVPASEIIPASVLAMRRETQVQVAHTFTEYKYVGGKKTVELRLAFWMENTPVTVTDSKGRTRDMTTRLSAEGVSYLLPENGLSVAEHMKWVWVFQANGVHLLLSQVQAKTLDWKTSLGIDPSPSSPALNREFLPLPMNVRIVAPGPTANRELAGFSGQWLGTWEGIPNKHTLVVEEIQGTEAIVVFAATGTEKPVAARTRGIFVDGALKLLSPETTLTYRMQPDGTVLATMTTGGRTFRSRMTRVTR